MNDKQIEKAIDMVMEQEENLFFIAHKGPAHYEIVAQEAGWDSIEEMAEDLGYELEDLYNTWIIADDETDPEGVMLDVSDLEGYEAQDIVVHSIVGNQLNPPSHGLDIAYVRDDTAYIPVDGRTIDAYF